MREQNHRLTTGLSAVYQWNEKRSPFLSSDQWRLRLQGISGIRKEWEPSGRQAAGRQTEMHITRWPKARVSMKRR